MIVIVGGGPVGLWLAAELRLGGAEVTVLEKRPERDVHSKALTVHPRTIEILASRGIHERFLAGAIRVPTGHFGGLSSRLRFAVLDTPFPFTLVQPQARTEELLEEHAVAMGADIRRGHTVDGLVQGAESVTVRVTGPTGPYEVEAAYVVGCDGVRSTVREAAGIAFPGTPATMYGWLGDVVLDDPPELGFSAAGGAGGLMVVPLPDGHHRLVGATPEDLRPEHPGELTLTELRAKVKAIAGTDFGMHSPVWLSRFGNATRQAERYRAGRVLVAGDAAHQHFPTGGVGLNVGVQDATNLGWKLAAVAQGRAPDDLLDTYHRERHPVGADLLEASQAQTALMSAFTPEGQVLRAFLAKTIATVPEFSRALAERLSGLSVAYPPDGPAHPLVGHRAPDLRFSEETLFSLLRQGRHVLLALSGSTDEALTALERDEQTPVPHGLIVHNDSLAETNRPAWSRVRAALIRPDGHVAWAQDA
ncbi:FAD-dependent monooxygenase [Actinomadura sp. NPDC047616]|uniref:FAD-dependent monooxygenase n=1 Tax=Actinomadura sp. NPDC047616 TaxID=3155914 RepID=UPI00340DACA3